MIVVPNESCTWVCISIFAGVHACIHAWCVDIPFSYIELLSNTCQYMMRFALGIRKEPLELHIMMLLDVWVVVKRFLLAVLYLLWMIWYADITRILLSGWHEPRDTCSTMMFRSSPAHLSISGMFLTPWQASMPTKRGTSQKTGIKKRWYTCIMTGARHEELHVQFCFSQKVWVL